MPSADGALLMIEDDVISDAGTFARNLTPLLQLSDASKVLGLVIGRFQKTSGGLVRNLLEQVIARQDCLAGSPVLGNVDFGHTNPLATFPIGGRAELAIGSDLPGRVAENG
jgi:muramoyltetrapeptide carboxypeptidase LdcA involved in peptidoglycan recycling